MNRVISSSSLQKKVSVEDNRIEIKMIIFKLITWLPRVLSNRSNLVKSINFVDNYHNNKTR